MLTTHDQLVGVTVFFIVLNTVTVGLRIFARTRLAKGAFGWDDAFLIFTYVSLGSPTKDRRWASYIGI